MAWLRPGWKPNIISRKAKIGHVQITTNRDSIYVYWMYRNGHPKYPGGETSRTFDTLDEAYAWADDKAQCELGGWVV